MKKVLLLLCFFTFCTTAFSQIPNYVPQNGLVGWWPFNGNANDESGNGNNGTVNGAILTNDRFGNSNSSFNFTDQLIQNIDIPQSNQLNSIQSLTISLWCNLLSHSDYNHYVNKSDQNPITQNGIYQFVFANNQTGVYFYYNNYPNFYQTNYLPQLNAWVHLVITYDYGISNLCNFYSNGVLFHSESTTGALPTTNQNIRIGGYASFNNCTTDGSLDDIGIWNRALTECEIQDLYQAQLNSVSQSISAGADQSICSGDNVTLSGAGGSNYQWNNNVVDGQTFAPAQSNAYVVTAQDSLGCTGIDTVVVTVLENSASTLTETSLDSYTLNGQTYTQSGTYTQTLTAANGCDSTITLNLTLNFTGIDELGTNAKKLVNITDLNGKTIPRRKNTLMLFIYEDGTVERVVEMEE
ncbi:MAG: hypothetical protein RL432_414 [Bacteroidota bacterium]|jgi:hypothetical protein